MDFLGHKLIPNSLRTPIHPREPIEQPLLLNIGLKKYGRRKIFGKERSVGEEGGKVYDEGTLTKNWVNFSFLQRRKGKVLYV